MEGFGFSPLETTIISTIPAATIQLGTFLGFSYIASHVKNVRLILAIIASIPPLVGASLLHALPLHQTAGRLAGYYLTFTYVNLQNRNIMTNALFFWLTFEPYHAGIQCRSPLQQASCQLTMLEILRRLLLLDLFFVGWAAGLIAGPRAYYFIIFRNSLLTLCRILSFISSSGIRTSFQDVE